MIKYFTYYSFGGYKDIYVGSDSDSADASYFIPLLNVWKKSYKPEDVKKIAQAESVKQVELITKSNSAGFPSECNLMFSHGGYKAIYRTLSDGRTCLCIRDIPNGTKDEEGRDTPFNFMFLADSEESIDKLDVFALQYLEATKETNGLIASAITYDYITNGFKFDLAKLDSLFSSDFRSQSNLKHRASSIDYLLVGSNNQISSAVKEQELDTKKVNAVFNSGRLIYGGLKYKLNPSMVTNQSNQDTEDKKSESALQSELTNSSEDNSTRPSVVEEIKKELAAHDMGLKPQEIEHKLSGLASKDDIESLKSLIKGLSKDSNYNLNKIQSSLEALQRLIVLPAIAPAQNDTHNLFKNRTYLIAIGCLIVGAVLGALIFQTKRIIMERVHLINLDSKVYEHPFDRAALNTLRNLPGFDSVTNFILNWAAVKWNLVAMQGSNFHVTRESCPELYKQIKEDASVIGVSDFPEIYTEWGYAINGYTTGNKDKTMLVLNSGAVDLLTARQLDYVVGHELGHIKSGHVLYHLMAQLFSNVIGVIPLGETLLTPIHYSLLYWQRMSEFTADRAGLLTCQDKDAAIEAIIKMAGAPLKYFDKLNKEAFLKQAEEFETRFSSVADSAIRTLSIVSSTHPWTVYRAGELLKWIESGEYDRILNEYAGIRHHCGGIIAKNATVCDTCGLPINH